MFHENHLHHSHTTTDPSHPHHRRNNGPDHHHNHHQDRKMEEHERVLQWKFWLEGVLIPAVGLPGFLGAPHAHHLYVIRMSVTKNSGKWG